MNTVILAAAFAATNAVANLPPVIVEASRLDKPAREIPGSVQILTSDEIAASGAASLPELLGRTSPQIHIRHLGGANPALAEIATRGYGENGYGRTAILVDGERLNSPDMNTPNLGRIALGAIDRIETLSGPQSVLLGDGASAGAVNVITEPTFTDGSRSYAEMRGGSWNTISTGAGTRGASAADGLKWWADGAWNHSDGYRHNSGYDLWNLNAGLKKIWGNGSFLKVSSFWNDSEYETPGHLSRADWHADPTRTNNPDDFYLRRTYGLSTVLKAQINDDNALKISGNVSQREMTAYSAGVSFGFPWWNRNTYDIWSYRLLSEWINTATIFGLDRESVVGAQVAYDRLHGWQRSNYRDTRCDYSRQTMDVYALESFRPKEWIKFQYGGRYSRAWSENTQCLPPRRIDGSAAFELAAIANPTEYSKAWLKWSRFYRNPFLDEIPYDPKTWLPKGLLRPETGSTSEIGFDWAPDNGFFAGAEAYWTVTEDEIFYDAPNDANVNSDNDTVRRGVDAHLGWKHDKVASVTLSSSWVQAEFGEGAYDRNRIPLVPETTVALNGRYWIVDDLSVLGGYRYQSGAISVSDFENAYARIPGYGVFHLGATWQPTWNALKGFSFAVIVDNLLDKNYCDYGTYGANYYPGSGRSYLFTVRYEF